MLNIYGMQLRYMTQGMLLLGSQINVTEKMEIQNSISSVKGDSSVYGKFALLRVYLLRRMGKYFGTAELNRAAVAGTSLLAGRDC